MKLKNSIKSSKKSTNTSNLKKQIKINKVSQNVVKFILCENGQNYKASQKGITLFASFSEQRLTFTSNKNFTSLFNPI